MKLNKSKNGISLIVLVITIIVMIILATAIILSLNSSNISGKASEARLTSDMANKKEAASVYLAEYEIKVAQGKINSETTSANDYVRAELKKAGLSNEDIAVTDDKEILIGIAAMFVNSNVPIGTEVKGYKLNNTTSYTTSGKENTFDSENYCEADNPQPANISRDDNVTWKYMGTDENGNALIAADVTENTPKIIIGGNIGYLESVKELNATCAALYSSSMGIARSINMEDVTRVLEYTGERGAYINDDYEPIIPVKTVRQIADMFSIDLDYLISQQWCLPQEDMDIASYKSNGYYIYKTIDIDEYNSDRADFIFPENQNYYWIASNAEMVRVSEDYMYVEMGIFVAQPNSVGLCPITSTYGDPAGLDYSIRPVVTLNSSVQMTYENGVVTLR